MKRKKLTLKQKESLTGFLFALPAIIGTVLFFLVPFALNFVKSFLKGRRFVFLQNYADVLGNEVFAMAAWNTLRFLLAAVPLIFLLAFGAALLLNRGMRGSAFFRTVFVFPMVLPVCSVILFFDILFAESGAMNGLFTALGLPVVQWLDSRWAFWVLVLLYIWKNIGYDIVLFLAALNSISKVFYEAADIEGASGWDKMRYVTLPMIRPHLVFLVVISVVNGFKAFREAYILCGDYPHESIYMLQHYINNNFQNLNYQKLAVGTIVIFLMILAMVLLIFLGKWRKEGGK